MPSVLRRRPVASCYVIGIAALALLNVVLTVANQAPWWSPLAVALPLGPTAFTLLAPNAVVDIFVSGPDGDAIRAVLLLAAVVALALLNAWIATVVDRTSGRERLVAGVLFTSAGALFVVLCFFDGFLALTAHGIDSPVPEARVQMVLSIATATFTVAAVAAVTGLVLWVVLWRRQRRSVVWALADLVMVGGSLAVVIATGS